MFNAASYDGMRRHAARSFAPCRVTAPAMDGPTPEAVAGLCPETPPGGGSPPSPAGRGPRAARDRRSVHREGSRTGRCAAAPPRRPSRITDTRQGAAFRGGPLSFWGKVP